MAEWYIAERISPGRDPFVGKSQQQPRNSEKPRRIYNINIWACWISRRIGRSTCQLKRNPRSFAFLQGKRGFTLISVCIWFWLFIDFFGNWKWESLRRDSVSVQWRVAYERFKLSLAAHIIIDRVYVAINLFLQQGSTLECHWTYLQPTFEHWSIVPRWPTHWPNENESCEYWTK